MGKRAFRRVVLLYHDPLLRDIVRVVFEQDPSIRVVAELPATDAPLEALVDARPDVVIVDRREQGETLPATVGFLLATLTEKNPGVRIIVMSLAEPKVFVFNGWQLPELPATELLACVHGTSEGASGGRQRRRQARRAAG
jgi:DNA-binding NarL/FixJ family response regulator